jgi:oligopeptidase B
LSEKIPRVDSAAWAADNQTLFYVTEDDAKRAWRVWRHKLGENTDTLVYEEPDALFTVEVDRSHSKRFVYVAIGSKTTDEVRYLRADHPDEPLMILTPREQDHEYSADDGGDLFYIRTNDKGRNFRLVTAPIAGPRRRVARRFRGVFASGRTHRTGERVAPNPRVRHRHGRVAFHRVARVSLRGGGG